MNRATKRPKRIMWAIAAGCLLAVCGCRAPASPDAAGTDEPLVETTADSTPHQVAAAFIRSLELFNKYEHTDRDRADELLEHAASMVSSRFFDAAIAKVTKAGLKLDPEKIQRVRQSHTAEKARAADWAVLIGYYTGHITYPKPSAPASSQPARVGTVTVRLPADRHDGLTRPVNIVVACTRTGAWKVESVGLEPVATTQPAPAK